MLATGIGLALKFLVPTSISPADVPSQAIETLFATRLADTAGRVRTLADWRGKVLVVNFWASWCPPCREEIPGFVRLQRKYRNNDVQFIGIAVEKAQEVAAFVEHNPLNYPILIGENESHELMRQLGNTSLGLPYTIVVDRNGKVSLIHSGLLAETQLDASLRQSIR